MSSDPISNYLKTNPSKSTTVYQGRRTLYDYPGDESLYAATYTYLDRIENALLAHWYNGTSKDQQYQKSYTTELSVTEGKEFSTSVDLGVSFKGLSVGTSTISKTFSQTETTTSETKTLTVNVPAHADLFFYQRKYVFRTKMTWVLDAWNEFWNVGSQGAYHIQEGEVMTEIWAEDYVTVETELKNTNTLTFESLPYSNQKAGTTRKWENTTKRCKNTLEAIGIDGSQQ